MYQKIEVVAYGGRGEAEAVVVGVFGKSQRPAAGYRKTDERCGGAILAAIKRSEFTGGKEQVTTLYPAKGPARLYLVGLGDEKKLDGQVLRASVGRVVRMAKSAGVKTLRVELEPVLSGKIDAELAGRAIGDGLALGNLEITEYKGKAGRNSNGAKKKLSLKVEVEGGLLAHVQRGMAVGASVNVARELAATPPNVANPHYLADYCRKMARQVGLKCMVIDEKGAKRLGMGGLLAVGGAGSTPPVLIVLEYSPARAVNRDGPIMLVGKAVTFDTGGYSIKPSDGMKGMKYDKCGGMAVIGALRAAATMKLGVRVVGLIPAAENMIAPEAYRLDDIVTMHNGVTVEITNTDAEGRMILADALSYGIKTYKPSAVIDLATLTGGVVVALGSAAAGIFCTTRRLRRHLFESSDFTGEKMWELPMWEEYKSILKGTHGDIVNSGIREAHPIQGAVFLSYFTGKDGQPRELTEFSKDIPGVAAWAHIDIAGVASKGTDSPPFVAGPTGWGVRLLVRAMETWGEYRG